MKFFRLRIFFIFGFFLLFSCTHRDQPKGSESNPIEVSLIPSKEASTLLNAGNEFKNWMEKETGLKFNVSVPNNYVAVIEALGSKRADLAFLTTNSYAIAFKKYNVQAKFITVNANGNTNYRGQFIVLTNSKIKKIEDIQGKKIAYVDSSSASGFIMPAYLLNKKNIKPAETVYAGKHDAVVTMVYQGQVDVGATFYSPPENNEIKDARRLVKTQFPDVENKIKILDFTDELPNDALVFRRDMAEDLKLKIELAIEKWAKTPEGLVTLKALNNGNGLKKVNDDNYLEARKMLESMENQIK